MLLHARTERPGPELANQQQEGRGISEREQAGGLSLGTFFNVACAHIPAKRCMPIAEKEARAEVNNMCACSDTVSEA